jgi:hypothetical protein
MGISSRKEHVNIHPYSSTTSFLHNLTQQQVIEFYDGNSNSHNDGDIINHLDIAEGLKNMLVRHGFRLESLLNIRPDVLAEMFGIDEYVAKIVIRAAYNVKKKS